MFFLVDDEFRFYSFTKSATRKFENITSNNRVALTVIFLKEQKTLQAEGTINNVQKGTEKYHNVILELANKNAKQGEISWPPPLSRAADSDIVVYQLVPDWLRYCDHSSPDEEKFYQIIPPQNS